MIATQLMFVLVVFLCTYFVHSTLLMAPTWFLISRRRWLSDPGLRSRLLKLSFIAPLVTTVALTIFGTIHFGPQVPLKRSETQVASEKEPAPAATTLPEYAHVESVSSANQPYRDTNLPPSELPVSDSMPATGAEQDSTRASDVPSATTTKSIDWRMAGTALITICWLVIACAGLIRLAIQWFGLQRIRINAQEIADLGLLAEMERQKRDFGIHRRVALRASSHANVPLAAGIVHPFILFPFEVQARNHRSAMLAHELAHIASRDALWNLLAQMVCRVFFFQPFNWVTSKAIRQEMDFQADSMAVRILGERMSLVQCLYSAGKQMSGRCSSPSPAYALASGMAMFQSTLGKRIEALLDADQAPKRAGSLTQTTLILVMLFGALSVTLLAPRTVVEAAPSNNKFVSDRNDTMNRTLASLLVVAGLSVPATADEPTTPSIAEQDDSVQLSTTPDELPDGILRFNGMLVGRLASKDVEQGTFTVRVDAVSRVWRNSGAEDPRSIVGTTIEVSGVFGKFLDVLVVTRTGETLEFECKHDGEGLVFPGELLRKVAPYDPEDYPEMPEEFRGFRGQVSAEILKKDPETFELIIRVDSVIDTWEDNSADDPNSIEGKSLMLAGFWNRREAYHDLKVGDQIEVGMQHIGMRSEHMTVARDVNKIGSSEERAMEREERPEGRGERMERNNPQQGFRGMLVGRLVEKDVERGTFTITVDAVPRVWQNNRSQNPKAMIGTNVSAEGVSGQMIDALVVAKVGETIEFGALHEEGPRVRVGEVLRKVAPVQPGDYPVLPDDFRGFRGMVTGKVIRKGDEIWELIVEIEEVHDTFEGNRAENPQSIVGEQVMLAGFWNRKDDFHDIRVGDRIRCGMNHTQLLSDHLTVVESIRKLDD